MIDNRTAHINTRMRPAERARIERAAKSRGLSLTDYCRETLLRLARLDLLRKGRK